ncbi:MAG TPA: prepilin-type N-terminal cleavage/methylation domain-containing protein [Patescibacteria group bacterium]|jgi:prepilin-type N-terminal cleavage/methylation domain-containing protein|nr:prepilin-type N-terminal cleavage/methylation domain-containing protein [Patescibacteria group bacterium]
MKQRGFTLIELLVVISIIGLLAAVVLVSLNTSRAKARNSRRAADAKQIITAFNLGLNNNASLPSAGGTWVCVSVSCYGSWTAYTANATVDAFLSPYIQKPTDPVGGPRAAGGYLYLDTYGGGVGPYDGSSFSAGAYYQWLSEPPVNSTSCGAARIYAADTNEVTCLFKLN